MSHSFIFMAELKCVNNDVICPLKFQHSNDTFPLDDVILKYKVR